MKASNTIEDAKIINEYGRLYVDLTLISEDEHVIKKIHIPKIALPIVNTSHINVINNYHEREYAIDFGMGELPVIKTADGVAYTVELIKEKRKEMTVSEIEKELGYKIKIVGESDTSILDLL